MKSLLLTLDYELYGNGSGNVFSHIIEPTEKILKVLKEHKTHITFFFEVVEYWKLKEEWEKGNDMGYKENPIIAIENQIRKAYKEGHDFQLHLHPQWVDAKWENGTWKVDFDNWRLGGYNKEGEFSLTNLIQKGKDTLESIIFPIDENYRCVALRAGGYNIQPSKEIFKVMKTLGLTVDSSIYPGGLEKGTLSQYDYSSIPKDLGMWYCAENFENIINQKSDIIELPIVAFPIIRIFKYLSFDKIMSLLKNKNSAKEAFISKTGGNRSTLFSKIKYFFQKEWQTWDYCLFSTCLHKQYIKNIKLQKERDVFVLVGHPKSFTSDKGLCYLLTHTLNYDKITFTQYLKSI